MQAASHERHRCPSRLGTADPSTVRIWALDDKAFARAADPGRAVFIKGDEIAVETAVVGVVADSLDDGEVGRRAAKLVAADVGRLGCAKAGDGISIGGGDGGIL